MSAAAHLVVQCPHCGTANNVQPQSRPQIVLCDTEGGGCDRYFAVQVDTTVVHEIHVARLDYVAAGQGPTA